MRRCRKVVALLMVTTILGTVVASTVSEPTAMAATNGNLNFQARLMTNTGSTVSDGYYNLQFKLYDAVSGGSNVWTETYYDEDGSGGTSGDDYRVRVKNGYLTVNLGSRTAFGNINWDQNLWITMNVGGTTVTATPTWNGEMSPRLKLTGVPYAFRAGTLVTGSGTYQSTLSLIQPTVGNQVFQILDRAAAGTYNILTNDYVSNAAAGTTAVQLQGQGSATAPVLALKGGATPGGGADLLRLKDSSDNALAGFTSSGQLYLGRAGGSGATGSLVLYNSTNANTVTIQSGTTGGSGYTLTLPTAIATNNQCLAAGTVSGTSVPLTFTACGGGGGATTYSYDTGTDADGGDITAGTLTMYKASGTTPGLLSADGQTIGGAKTFTADTTITRDSATAFRVQNAGGTISVMNVDTTTQTLTLRSLADAATLSGTELMTGAFNAATNWGSISGTGAAATATHSAGSTTAITTATPASVTIGKTYQVTFTTSGVTAGSGTVTASLGGLTGKAIDTNKSGEVQVFSSVTGTTGLAFTPTSGFIGTVTGVSVKEITNQAPTLVLNDSSNATTIELRSGTAAARNIGLGIQALQSNTTGTLNIGIGTAALKRNTTGTGNTAIGDISMQNNTTGGTNTGVGASSLRDNTTGSQNTAVGATALMVNTIGGNNTALGGGSLLANTSGSDNTSVGYSSQQLNTTGVGNSSIGVQSLSANTTGSYNTAIGTYAGYLDSDGFVPGAAQTNSTAIGYRAQAQASNSLVLGGAGNNAVNVGIGTTLPDNTLSVSPYQLAATNSGVITASQSTTTVTASSGIFTAAMVGSKITWLSGANAGATATISGYTSTTVVTVSGSATVASGTFRIGATASQTTTTVTAASSVFTAAMVGSKIIWANGAAATITAYSSGTSVTVTPSQSVSSNEFRVHYVGLQVTSAGKVGVGTTAPAANFQVSTPVNTTTAFQVQNASGNPVVNVDTTTNTLTLRSLSETVTAGSELFTTGTFSAATNWAITGGSAQAAIITHTAGSTATITTATPISVSASTWYRVAFTVTPASGQTTVSGTVTPTIGNTAGRAAANNTSGAGTYQGNTEVQVILAANTNNLLFTPSTDFNGVVTAVSVTQLTPYNATLSMVKSDGTTKAFDIRAAGTNSLGMGIDSLQVSSGASNTAYGAYTLRRNTIGYDNAAFGTNTMALNTTGFYNSAFGSGALNVNTSGYYNTAVGTVALAANTTGVINTAIGAQALNANISGANNTALGATTLKLNTTGSDNTAAGRNAMPANTTGSLNSAFGSNALQNNTTGSGNVAVGNAAGGNNTTGSNNTSVGYYAGANDDDGMSAQNNLSNSATLGYRAVGQASNTAIIGGAGSNAVNVGIGTSLPDNTLSVSPYQLVTTTNSGSTTASQATTTVTASSSIFTAGMVGYRITWTSGANSGMTATISGYTSGTVVTVSPSQTAASGTFRIAATASQTTTTVTASASVFTAAMVGSKIIWTNGSSATITAYSSGTSVTVSPSQSVSAAEFRVHYVGLQVTSAGKVGIGTTAPAANFQVATGVNTTTAMQITNAGGNEVITVDTTNGQLTLGKASTLQGKLVFYGTAGANTVSLLGPSSNPASSFTMTLPSTIANSNECLKAGTVAAGNVPLVFGSCGGGASTLQDAYTGSGANPFITLDGTNAGIKIRNATSNSLSTDLLAIQNNAGTATYFGAAAGGITIQNSSGVNAMTFENTTNHLKIYNPSDVAKYVDIYYDNTNNEAVFASVGGTTRIGNGTGNINFQVTGASDVIQASKTVASLSGAYSLNDFSISQALTGGANAISGSVLNVTSTSTTSSTNTQNMLRLSQASGTATGNLILGVVNSVNVFQVANTGATTIRDSASSATSFQVQNSAGNAVFSVDTGGVQAIFGKASSLTGKVTFYNSGGANAVSLTVASASAAYALTLPSTAPSTAQCLKSGASTAGLMEWGSCGTGGGGGSTRTITLVPEFAGGVMYGDGGTNSGTMTSDFDSTNYHNYYNWTATNGSMQDYNIVTRTQIPSEYVSGFGSSASFKVWVRNTNTSTTNNDILLTIRDNGNAACTLSVTGGGSGSSVSLLHGTANTWDQKTITVSSCTNAVAANHMLTLDFQLQAKSSNAVRIGEVSYTYTN